jgi:sporulation protein YlmC with PRC-barrel domain
MATSKREAILIRLRDTEYVLKNDEDDIRGRKVVDENGDEIGRVAELLIDENEKRVRFIGVEEGGFLGIGARELMIPVDAVRSVDEETVRISHSRDKVASAPKFDPELAECDYYENVCAHYGYPPFWSGAYMYPNLPMCRHQCVRKDDS